MNHLYLRDPLTDETVQAFRDFVPRVVAAGATAAQVLRVDDTHLVLILDFASAEDAIACLRGRRAVDARTHHATARRGPERSVGEVIASATASGS